VKKTLATIIYFTLSLTLISISYTISFFSDTETSTNNLLGITTLSSDNLLINEVMYDPTQKDNFNEWIELYNPTNNPVDVDGWRIVDNNEEDLIEGDDVNGNGTTIIPPHGYAIITDSNTLVYDNFTIPENAIKLRVEDNDIGNDLGNKNDKIILKNATGSMIDAIEWGSDYSDVPGSPIPDVNEGYSIARYTNVDTDDTLADFYDEDNPTPGSENM